MVVKIGETVGQQLGSGRLDEAGEGLVLGELAELIVSHRLLAAAVPVPAAALTAPLGLVETGDTPLSGSSHELGRSNLRLSLEGIGPDAVAVHLDDLGHVACGQG